MHDAVDVALVLGAHGDDIAALTLRHQRLLQVGLDVTAVHQAIQRAQQALLGDTQLAAQAVQLGAGIVQHVAAIADAARNLRHHVVARLDVYRNRGQVRERMLQSRQQRTQLLGPLQGELHLQQVGRHEHGTALGAIEQRAQIADTAKVDVILLLQEVKGLAGLDQPFLHRDQIVAGQKRFGQLRTATEGAVLSQPLEDLRIFQYTQRAWVHKFPVPTSPTSGVTAIIS